MDPVWAVFVTFGFFTVVGAGINWLVQWAETPPTEEEKQSQKTGQWEVPS